MDSITIKTYLMDFIYNILDNKKFQNIFIPSEEEFKDIKNQDNILFNPVSEAKAGKKKKLSHFNVYHVLESFMGCVMKVLQLLFIEKKDEANDLYESIFDRLGESVLGLVNGSYVSMMKKMRRNSLFFEVSKNGYFDNMEMIRML